MTHATNQATHALKRCPAQRIAAQFSPSRAIAATSQLKPTDPTRVAVR